MHLHHVSTMDTEERSAISNGIKIRHRSRCLRPSVWPTPAADNRLPVRWTRAVDTNHTAAHAAAALKTAPEPLRFALRIKADLHRQWPIYALRLAALGLCAWEDRRENKDPACICFTDPMVLL